MPEGIASLSALASLVLIPLAFHDGFFDINRIKVHLALTLVPLLAILWLCQRFLNACQEKKRRIRHASPPIAMAAFLAFCVQSCAIHGFSQETLWGSSGRYCGLLFLLSCGALYAMIACSEMEGSFVLKASVCTAALISLLGIVNGCGFDPLGFYVRIKKEQVSVFLSTIGNIDFFGAYLSMLFPLAAAKAALAQKKPERNFFVCTALLITLGVAFSRSDTAYCALQIAFMILAALCGDSLSALLRVNLLWSFSFFALPLARAMLARGKWEISFSGLFALLCNSGAAWAFSLFFLLAAYGCGNAFKKGMRPPGSARLLCACAALIGTGFAALAAVTAYFSVFDPDAELGALSFILRFNDAWGSRRGFVYRCSAEAFCDFSPLQKLFGKGVDCTKSILTPYFSDERMLKYGVFNDAHCQPLQFLLTTGIAGSASFIVFYLKTLRLCFRCAKHDPILRAVSASLCGYAVIALLNVTQPILILTYLTVSALAVSHINHIQRREYHES